VIKENRRGGRYCFAKEKRSRGRAPTAATKTWLREQLRRLKTRFGGVMA
jgi:hypothetical protein